MYRKSESLRYPALSSQTGWFSLGVSDGLGVVSTCPSRLSQLSSEERVVIGITALVNEDRLIFALSQAVRRGSSDKVCYKLFHRYGF